MKFLTLLEIEFKKIMPILAVLFGGGFVVAGGLFYTAIKKFKGAFIQQAMGQTVAEYVSQNGTVTLSEIIDRQPLIIIAFILIALLIVMSGFYLWYKEWFGQSKRIYMLLTLKGSRFTIFLSKLCVIVSSIILYYGFVLLSLVLGTTLMHVLLPEGLVGENLLQGALLQQRSILQHAIPTTMAQLAYELSFVVMMFSILSTFVLFDRSKRIFGMIMGALYGIATVALFIYINTLFLFQDEVFYANWAFVIGTTLISILLSAYLLEKKVTI